MAARFPFRLAVLAAVGAALGVSPPAAAQGVDLGALGGALGGVLGEGTALSGHIIQGIVVLTVLSVAPGLLIMVTSFTRIVVVLSLLRSALGLQQSPPNMVMISLAMFLTIHVMAPVFDSAWQDGVRPLLNEQVTQEQGLERIIEPFRAFMSSHVRDKDLSAFAGFSRRPVPEPGASPDLRTLIPAFLLSELRRAFEIGFLLFLPFLVIDMVVAAVLMAMGMMMLPPAMIALPFKIIFFVLTDGWFLIAGSLIRSYGGG
ncbi:flagellar type III secretion system pore protein FliP [Azospirillum sp. TSO22-1]|uniref:flagellar type III secretion system pore protein FliP n=1 Tax=Azospirillum sp. TSO22-1 TaxID=716789 RepID=UPI000D6098AD|nr:flagellar type III secretion system pore protein FliP [Azospirillum sp. TSO22-1]PWC35157.1 flagellar biosynthetic protein flip [Azospirillum sp. TSO22-1]